MPKRRGYSIIELIIAIVVMGLVMAGAMNFFVGQSRTFRRGSSDMVLLQNVRFAADLLGQHFRAVGANVTAGQPSVIFASATTFAFNADYATNTPGDLDAIYVTPSAPDAEVSAPRVSEAFGIPGSALDYPSVDYEIAPGFMSPAEAITFWFAPDTETVRPDDYVLFRMVNGQQPEAVIRNVLADPTAPFFRYFYLRQDPSSTASLDTVSDAILPLSYGVLGPQDTLTTQLRAIQISFIVTNGLTGPTERQRPFSLVIQLPNLGQRALETCGNEPLAMSAPTATVNADGKSVDVAFDADGDELGGERDVTRYVLWRRPVGALSWGDPLATVPAGGTPPYDFNDATIPPSGGTLEYAVAAQDCTPSFSDPVVSNPVTLP